MKEDPMQFSSSSSIIVIGSSTSVVPGICGTMTTVFVSLYPMLNGIILPAHTGLLKFKISESTFCPSPTTDMNKNRIVNAGAMRIL